MMYGEKIGGDTIFTEGNHYNFGDVHPQYVGKSLCNVIPKITDLTKPYYALTTVNIYNDDVCIVYEFDIFSVDLGEVKKAKYLVKIFVESLSNGTRTVYVQKDSAVNMNDIDIKVSVVDNGTKGNIFYIYLVQTESTHKFAYIPTKEISTRNNAYSYDIAYGASYRSTPIGNLIN